MIKCNFCRYEIEANILAHTAEFQIMEFYINREFPIKKHREVHMNHGIVTACGECLIRIFQFFDSLCGVRHMDYTERNWRTDE